MKTTNTEICCECGVSVAFGSGRYVNRIPECNDINTRKEMGRPFPDGNYVCWECDANLCDNEDFE